MNKPEIYFDENSTNKIKLKDIAVLKNGYSFNSKQYTKSGKYNIITISNVQGKRFTVINDGTNKISILPSNLMSYQVLKDFDILVSMTGNVGRVSYNKGQNNLLNQRVGLIEIISKKIIREYLYQILSCYAFEKEMQINSQGAAQLNISKLDIESYQFYLPSFEEQEKIAALLSNFDSKIEQEVKIIEKLKIIKKSLLDKMFPREGCNVPDLRFSRYENPWEQRKLGDVYIFQYGKFNNNPDNGGPYPIYGANGIIGGYSQYNSEDSAIIGHMGAYAGYVIWAEGKHFVTYNGTIAKSLSNFLHNKYGYYLLCKKEIYKICAGSGQPFISYEDLVSIPIIISRRIKEQEKIGDFFSKIDSLLVLHQRKSPYFLYMPVVIQATGIYSYYFKSSFNI